jgi:TnpA family transposase
MATLWRPLDPQAIIPLALTAQAPAQLPDQRFWRPDRHADYGPLDRLARHRINIKLIIEQWEDILRVAGSLSTGSVRASELMRVLQGGGHPAASGVRSRS